MDAGSPLPAPPSRQGGVCPCPLVLRCPGTNNPIKSFEQNGDLTGPAGAQPRVSGKQGLVRLKVHPADHLDSQARRRVGKGLLFTGPSAFP